MGHFSGVVGLYEGLNDSFYPLTSGLTDKKQLFDYKEFHSVNSCNMFILLYELGNCIYCSFMHFILLLHTYLVLFIYLFIYLFSRRY